MYMHRIRDGAVTFTRPCDFSELLYEYEYSVHRYYVILNCKTPTITYKAELYHTINLLCYIQCYSP